MRLTASAVASLLLFVAPAAFAQTVQTPPIRYQPAPDSPIGVRNPSAPEGLAQFDFVIGDWDVDITFRPANGAETTYRARWHNSWIVDGFVVMQEWRGPYTTGAEFRYYHPQSDSWTGYNVYPGSGWKPTTARRDTDTMVIVIEGGQDPRGAFLNRETYFDISESSFRMRSDRSYDGGESWERGAYEMVARRAV